MFDPLPQTLMNAIETTQGLEGWCPHDKAVDMAALVLRERPKVCVEIGVFGGRSFLPQALALKYIGEPAIIYGIDPFALPPVFEGTNHGAETWTNHDFNATWNTLQDQIKRHELEPYVSLIREHSHTAAARFLSEGIDILHVDGNHSTEISTGDVQLYLPLVKPGGYIWLDDSNWESVRNALELLDKACEVIKDYSIFRLYRKPKP